MHSFNAQEWASTKSKVEWEISDGHREYEITVTSQAPVQLRGIMLDSGDHHLLRSGADWRLRLRATGYDLLCLTSPSGKEFGYRVREITRQAGEPINHDDPPAAPMPANNLLSQIRNMMRDEFQRSQGRLLEPEQLPFANRYEVDDDDELFEEEIYAAHQETVRKMQNAPGNDLDPPAAPEAPQEGEDPPSSEEIAAE